MIGHAFYLIGSATSYGAAIIEIVTNSAADSACFGSAAGTATSFDECEDSIPQQMDRSW
jgi:hypothetical protein